jgi:glucose/arabinose dehydrogenase
VKYVILLLLLSPGSVTKAQPGQVNMSPKVDLGLQSVAVEVPSKYSSVFPSGKNLWIPQGYKARVFYAGGLTKPRSICFSPKGVLYVSDMRSGGLGVVYALPDSNQDGIADTAIVVASGFTYNHDLKFYKGDLYVTETTKVWKCRDTDQDGIYETKTVFISNIAGGATTGHYTRTIVFDSLNQKVYLSIGSSCNVCRENDRAIIEQYNDDGSGKRTYATGIRNAVGMTLHPVTNRLWANNNGSDNKGNELPPEWIDLIRDGGFYGWPFAYANQVWFTFDAPAEYAALKPITAIDSGRVASMLEPAALIRAHSAPLGIHFLNSSFALQFRKGFLNSLHGSWNTTSPNDFRGYSILFAHLGSDQDTTVNYVSDFCTGFLTDTVNRIYWGRPVGLAVNNKASVFFSSDESSRFIMELYADGPTGIEQPMLPKTFIGKAYPNPSREEFILPLVLHEKSLVQLTVYDMLGRKLISGPGKEMPAGEYQEVIRWGGLAEGFYIIRLECGADLSVQKIYHSR